MKSRSTVALSQTMENVEESYNARVAEDSDQFKALSRRTRTISTKHKKSYIKGFAEEIQICDNANDIDSVSSEKAPSQIQILEVY